jgi:uncharacterized membrane protein YdjX (TVP38/TMEM64 family)
MRRYALLALALGAPLVAVFFVAQYLGLSLLEDPRPALARLGPAAALLSVALLVADAVLPVPSSVVMICNGAFFGAVGGTLLSTAGMVGATAAGFALGRGGTRFIARFTRESERRSMDALLARWGGLAIALTRPVPILAETAALLAGTTSMSWGSLLAGALAGTLPISIVYAAAGAHARETSTGIVFLGAFAGAGALWVLGHFLSRRTA